MGFTASRLHGFTASRLHGFTASRLHGFTQACAALAAIAALAGCATPYSAAPVATNFPSAKQQKLQAASHWNVIAADTAETLLGALHAGKGCIAASGACDRVVVKDSNESGAFGQAFRTQLVTSLVNGGVNVVKNPHGATEVDVDVQVVRFSPNRPQYRFTSVTALGAGILALHEVAENSNTAAGFLAAGAFDAATWYASKFASGPTPQYEIIVTVSASDAEKYLARTTNVYYVDDRDARLYFTPPPAPLYTFNVKGGE